MLRRSGLTLMIALGSIGLAGGDAPPDRPLDRIRRSGDGRHFVHAGSGERFAPWGVNYDHDDAGRLLEDYWADDWAAVEGDFREIRALGANVVRVHLQVGKFLDAADRPNAANLARLARLVRLAEATGLYLDVTGLGCYHKAEVPRWYADLDEAARWAAQATFWRAVAGACGRSPAVFCFDLMNEPILAGGPDPKDWLPGAGLDGKHFVQRITTDARGRTDTAIAGAWVARLAGAIRATDPDALITVGEIPWVQVFGGGSPLFQQPEVAAPLDFASVHFYPRAGKLDADLAALKAYDVGKPVVIEEIFPLGASLDETVTFIERSRSIADGHLSFYWGKPAVELEQANTMNAAIVAAWLRKFATLAPR